ncbi:hypothetical protein GCM10009819_30330 [Agromyces tropicus]|uniref:ROK family protein n=1 Tax=Agromyces tropicus TaxID=555371 RepID=A0ABP5G8H2_9MICO
MSRYLGIDYGGTQSKLLLTREAPGGLERVREARVPTPQGGDSVEALARLALEFLGPDRIAGFAVTIAGIVDAATGRVVSSANLPWLDGTDPAARIAARIGAPGLAVQDGAAAAEAEATIGAGRGFDDIFVVALGTGVAGAHVVDGRVRAGAHGAAGEIGHIGPGTGARCSCGQRGCLETLIGGARIGDAWDEVLGLPAGSTNAAGGARVVVDAADGGEARAIALLDRATTALGRSLLGVVAMIDPEAIVVGGGLSQSTRWILDPAVRTVRREATFHRLPEIVPSQLGVWAGAWGAAIAARRAAADPAPTPTGTEAAAWPR